MLGKSGMLGLILVTAAVWTTLIPQSLFSSATDCNSPPCNMAGCNSSPECDGCNPDCSGEQCVDTNCGKPLVDQGNCPGFCKMCNKECILGPKCKCEPSICKAGEPETCKLPQCRPCQYCTKLCSSCTCGKTETCTEVCDKCICPASCTCKDCCPDLANCGKEPCKDLWICKNVCERQCVTLEECEKPPCDQKCRDQCCQKFCSTKEDCKNRPFCSNCPQTCDSEWYCKNMCNGDVQCQLDSKCYPCQHCRAKCLLTCRTIEDCKLLECSHCPYTCCRINYCGTPNCCDVDPNCKGKPICACYSICSSLGNSNPTSYLAGMASSGLMPMTPPDNQNKLNYLCVTSCLAVLQRVMKPNAYGGNY